jgi:shikimate 5-dehydrogenase
MSRLFGFVGVTTRQSAVVPLFESWCRALRLNWELRHWDIELDASRKVYDQFLSSVRSENYVGALVTTHKANLYSLSGLNFDLLEPSCVSLAEVGVVYRRGDAICGGVSDIESGGAVLERIVLSQHWKVGSRRAVVLGAGGAGLAAAWNLAVRGVGHATSVTLVEARRDRLLEVQDLLSRWPTMVPLTLEHTTADADKFLTSPEPAGLVINATGLGKDRPGSPIASAASLPDRCMVWDFNYRGTLEFLKMARKPAVARDIECFDGGDYFAAGWSVVMCRVAGIPWSREIFEVFRVIAEEGKL